MQKATKEPFRDPNAIAHLRRAAATQLFDTTPLAVMITDRHGTILDTNPGLTRITGYARDELLGKTPKVFNSGHHDRAFYDAFWRQLLTEGSWTGEIWNRRKNGTVFPEWLTITALRDQSGEATHYVAIFSDISLAKAADERTIYLAHHDPLTGLPNRTLFVDRLEQALARFRRLNKAICVAIADMDGFKQVNDRLGHACGDKALQIVSNRMREVLRENDTLARIGGDEFALLFEGFQARSDVEAASARLIEAAALELTLDGRPARLTVSIGLAFCPDAGRDRESLLSKADEAMYLAKRAGKNRFVVATW